MDYSTITSAAILKGQVCEQFIKCGKPRCRCGAGYPHGPYYYRVWRDGDVVRKEYIRPELLAEVRDGCERYKQIRLHLREMDSRLAALTRGLNQGKRVLNKITKTAT